MKTIFDHIERIKGKPHHARKRIAFTAAASGAALIGLVWLVGNLSTGAFLIQGSTFADSVGQGSVTAVGSSDGSQGLAGAAAALPASDQNSTGANEPAHIEIIDTASSTAAQPKAEQTVIPF